jgi:hypothetical protein
MMPPSITTKRAAQTPPVSQPPPAFQLLPVAPVSGLPPGLPKPTNHLYVERTRAITEDFVVVPTLHIPADLLPPPREVDSDDDKKNLNLISGQAVNTNIWLAGNQEKHGDQKVRSAVLLAIKSGKGCTVTVVRYTSLLIPS